MAVSFTTVIGTVVVGMLALIGLGTLAGIVLARVRVRRLLKAFKGS